MADRFCAAMFEEFAPDTFMGDVHTVDDGPGPARYVTAPLVGGGAVRVLLCSDHADEIARRFPS